MRSSSHSSISDFIHPLDRDDNLIGLGNSPIEASRYIDDPLRPVKVSNADNLMICCSILLPPFGLYWKDAYLLSS